MINVNDYRCRTDSETIEFAIQNRTSDGIVVIPPRVSDIEPERSYWRIDRAILLPENTTVVLQNCKIKLSDKCRDNFFRTANCGFGFPDPAPIRNVHIRGEGFWRRPSQSFRGLLQAPAQSLSPLPGRHHRHRCRLGTG